MALDFQAGYRSVFADPKWFRKSLVLSLYCLIPIVGPFVFMGAILDRVLLVREGRTAELPPDTSRFGEHLVTGFLVSVPPLALYFLSVFTFGLGFIAYIPFAILYPALLVHYLVGGRSFGDLFQFKASWEAIKAHSEAYVNYWLVSIAYGIVASLVTTPLIFMAEMPLLSVAAAGDDAASAVLAGGLLVSLLVFGVVFFVSFVLSTMVSLAAYYYLGEFARQAYPVSGAPEAGASVVAEEETTPLA